jgi:SAM-dependent methyltransferase
MHPRVYREYEQICSTRNIIGSVLEVGAIPSRKSLLCMKSLGAVTEKVGLDLAGPHEFRDFQILQGNANQMDMFEDGRFDAVLCNATLEHDRFFWRSVAEMRRVTKPGGLLVIGAPGYRYYSCENLKSRLGKLPLLRRLASHDVANALFTATLTLQVHNYPGDYYRFSEQAFREVLLEGLDNVEVRSVMVPPRIIGVRVKPRAGNG